MIWVRAVKETHHVLVVGSVGGSMAQARPVRRFHCDLFELGISLAVEMFGCEPGVVHRGSFSSWRAEQE